jgi:hypothetical protein
MKKVRPLEVNGRTECVLGIGLLASAILCRWLRWLGASGQVTLLEIATVWETRGTEHIDGGVDGSVYARTFSVVA